MAEPIPFFGHNNVFGGDGYLDLPAFNNGVETIVCWKLNDLEYARVVETREVWSSMKTGPAPIPHKLTGLPLMEARDVDTGHPVVYFSDGRHFVADARYFATTHHGEQRYGEGDKPHTYHLEKVVQVLIDFGYGWFEQIGGWLHDVEEDCWTDLPMKARRAIVRDRYGDQIETMVWACTGQTHINGVKQNRKARGAEIAAKLEAFPPAKPVKAADRIANMEECVLTEGPLGAMYIKETQAFAEQVASHIPNAMLERLWTAHHAILAYLDKGKEKQ